MRSQGEVYNSPVEVLGPKVPKKAQSFRVVHYKPYRFVDVVVLFSGSTPVARGISVCSPRDWYNPDVGLRKACGRAVKAVMSECSSLPIHAHRFYLPYGDRLLLATEEGKFKAEYLPYVDVWVRALNVNAQQDVISCDEDEENTGSQWQLAISL